MDLFFHSKIKGALLPEGSKIVLTNVLGSWPYFCISWNVYSSKGNHSYAQGWETRKYSLVITIPKKKTMSSLYIGSWHDGLKYKILQTNRGHENLKTLHFMSWALHERRNCKSL